jgi:hypothetical protein
VHKGEDERALAEEHSTNAGSDGKSAATGEVPQQITAAVEAGEDT